MSGADARKALVDPRVGSRCMGGQERWAQGSEFNLEGEHDGCEPDECDEDGGDNELSLGWTRTGAHGNTMDLEFGEARA